jgi:hypothetical protein
MSYAYSFGSNSETIYTLSDYNIVYITHIYIHIYNECS